MLKNHIRMSSISERHWWFIFHKEVKSWDSRTWFRIWKFWAPAWKQYLQMHLMAERFVYRGDNWGFWKRESKDETNLTAPIPPHNAPNYLLSSHLYSPWNIHAWYCWRSLWKESHYYCNGNRVNILNLLIGSCARTAARCLWKWGKRYVLGHF